MAMRGLGRRDDLNQLVQMSLEGLIDEPERLLSELLRSAVTIDQSTRRVIADALDGRSEGTQLTITPKTKTAFVRRFWRLKRQIEAGHSIRAITDKAARRDAKKAASKTLRCSEASIRRFMSLAKKREEWIAQCRVEELNHSEAALEFAFVYGLAKRTSPKEELKPSVQKAADLMQEFENLVAEARGT